MTTTDQLAERGTESSAPWLGRCEHCDFALFSTTVASVERLRDVKADGRVFALPSGYHCARCPEGHYPFKMKMVKGTYSAKHQCDSRCLNAKGHDCTCSCGGMNHGRGHAITVMAEHEVKARIEDEPTHAQPSVHLGEVGQHIRGEVRIESKRDVSDATLYTFRTTSSGDVIKWFAPSHANPDWPVGKTLTIRAKVKKHETHERFGKSTHVIYVEEV